MIDTSSLVSRRAFSLGLLSGFVCGGCRAFSEIGLTYPGWNPGELDIHFIPTGAGEQTFFIFPDGTTMLLDCGDTHHRKYVAEIPPRPSDCRYAGEWVSRYIQRLIRVREIDHVMISHWHGDHTGDLGSGGKRLRDGRIACGIPLVAEDFHFLNYYDHQYPKMGEHAQDPDK